MEQFPGSQSRWNIRLPHTHTPHLFKFVQQIYSVIETVVIELGSVYLPGTSGTKGYIFLYFFLFPLKMCICAESVLMYESKLYFVGLSRSM